jgi:hypothetical protein
MHWIPAGYHRKKNFLEKNWAQSLQHMLGKAHGLKLYPTHNRLPMDGELVAGIRVSQWSNNCRPRRKTYGSNTCPPASWSIKAPAATSLLHIIFGNHKGSEAHDNVLKVITVMFP